MAQTVLITLTLAGTDVGPFDLYSDADGYVSAFATGVSRADLIAGYTSNVVPDFATTIKAQSYGTCTNSLILVIVGGTTTTTTTSTTTPPPYDVLLEFFGEVVGLSFNVTGYVVYGTVADNMTWNGLINTYTSGSCAGIPASGDVPFTLSFSIGNTAGYLTHDVAIAPYTGINTSKIVGLDLASPSTTITLPSEDITVSGTVYRIQGYTVCNPI